VIADPTHTPKGLAGLDPTGQFDLGEAGVASGHADQVS